MDNQVADKSYEVRTEVKENKKVNWGKRQETSIKWGYEANQNEKIQTECVHRTL